MKEEKMRKFAYKQAQNNQTQNSTTEATLILCDTRGRGPITEETTIKEEVRRRKMRKSAFKQRTHNQANNHFKD